MAQAENEAYFTNSWLLGEAEGFQYDRRAGGLRLIPDPNPDAAQRNPRGVYDRTGGLFYRRRVELADDNRLYRFGAKKFLGTGAHPLLPLLNSPWWMDRDRFHLLAMRSREAARPLVAMARDQLALPPDWTDADIVVAVTIRPGKVLAACAGPGITATGAGERRVIAPEAPHLLIDQLYIPGLGRHPALGKGDGPDADFGAVGAANAAAWFDLATASSFDPPESAIRG